MFLQADKGAVQSTDVSDKSNTAALGHKVLPGKHRFHAADCSPVLPKLHLGPSLRSALLKMAINRLSGGGVGRHALAYPSSRSLALLLEELETTTMLLSPAREGSIRAEDGHPLPSLLNPAVGWVGNIPLPTLVAYREKVFPGEIHHILPLERPECWVTCDSIGLFLETECQFPFESEDDFCYYHEELEVPRYRRQGCCLTKLFVKKVSVELIELYLRFLLPDFASPKLKLVCSPENRDRWIVPLHFDAFLERLYNN